MTVFDQETFRLPEEYYIIYTCCVHISEEKTEAVLLTFPKISKPHEKFYNHDISISIYLPPGNSTPCILAKINKQKRSLFMYDYGSGDCRAVT